MPKRDTRPMYSLALECGHYQMGPIGADRKRCRECRQMRRVTAVGELLRDSPAPVRTKVEIRSDGLTVRHFLGQNLKKWWCRFCWGNPPAKQYIQSVWSMEDLWAGWDRHKVSRGHVEFVKSTEAVERRWEQP